MARIIHCCACDKLVTARLTDGREIYPHRPDLFALPFWRCDACRNFVGCHHKTENRTAPLGCIPTSEIKEARKKIHAVIDPLWQSGKLRRGDVYKALSKELGRQYHTAHLRPMNEAAIVLKAAERIANGTQ